MQNTTEVLSPFANDWRIVSIPDDQQRRFVESINRDKYDGISALGILAAGQAYLEQNEVPEVTLVHNHHEYMWPTATKQLGYCLRTAGFSMRQSSISELIEGDEYAAIAGPMPAPRDVLALPKLTFLREMLNYHLGKGSHPHGFAYVGLSRADIAESYTLGYADPAAGTRSEIEVRPGHLKEQYGFPPPPPRFPDNTYQSRL